MKRSQIKFDSRKVSVDDIHNQGRDVTIHLNRTVPLQEGLSPGDLRLSVKWRTTKQNPWSVTRNYCRVVKIIGKDYRFLSGSDRFVSDKWSRAVLLSQNDILLRRLVPFVGVSEISSGFILGPRFRSVGFDTSLIYEKKNMADKDFVPKTKLPCYVRGKRFRWVVLNFLVISLRKELPYSLKLKLTSHSKHECVEIRCRTFFF